MESSEIKEKAACPICDDFFTDARILSCDHTFCSQCLSRRQETTCYVCHGQTVPTSEQEIQQLTTNEHVNEMVGELIRKKHDPWSKPTKDRMAKRPLRPADEGPIDQEPRHWGVTCDHCLKNSFKGGRYKCGMCDDYDLCEECERRPRDEVHDMEHLFIKLKTRQNGKWKNRSPALDKAAEAMGQSLNYKSTTHTYGAGGVTRPVKCDNCKTQPIMGRRYKCGICESYSLCEKCEEKSEEVHDKRHPFIVLRHPCDEPEPKRLLVADFYSSS